MYNAIVLAGGAARRLDGAPKPQLEVAGVRLLDRVVAAVPGAARVVVVGPRQPVAREVTWTRETPAGSGPVAALAAGLALVDAPVVEAPAVLVLAADLPWIAGAVAPLLAALPADGAAVLVDADGRRNHLAAAWRTASLRAALAALGDPVGAAVRAVFAAAAEVVEVPDPGGWGRDCDTWDDLARARWRAHKEVGT